jgi:hypothetical protein
MSPLPGWRLVWLLYGRFCCRSSPEVLRQWRTGARACGQGPCDAVSPAASPLIGDIAVLAWSGVPEGTKSFALLLLDVEGRAPAGVSHMVVYGIPAEAGP